MQHKTTWQVNITRLREPLGRCLSYLRRALSFQTMERLELPYLYLRPVPRRIPVPARVAATPYRATSIHQHHRRSVPLSSPAVDRIRVVGGRAMDCEKK